MNELKEKNQYNNDSISIISNNFIEQNENIDIIQKRELIQSEIIDKNYNLIHFKDFCNSRKKIFGDIFILSLAELKLYIEEFQNYHKSIDNNNHFLKKCKKIEKSKLSEKKILIKISNPTEIKMPFYQQNYINYEISTNITSWKVNRRYSDFLWLRETLKKFYPGVYIPSLIEKKIGPGNFEPKYIEKRIQFLTQFINDVLKNELFKSSDVVIDFLSIISRDNFELKKEFYYSKNGPMSIEENYSIDGTINLLNENKNIDDYFIKMWKYLDNQCLILDKMKEELKYFYNNINKAINNLSNIEKYINSLYSENEKFYFDRDISNIYFELLKFFKKIKNFQIEQNDLIKRYFKRFFKYISMENKSFTELIQKRNEYKDMYSNEKNISIFFDNNDISLKNDNESNLYHMLCYMNYNVKHQFNIFIKTQKNRFIMNIKSFIQEYINSLNKLVSSWADLASTIK